MRNKLTKPQAIRLAAHLAIKWEESVLESIGNCKGFEEEILRVKLI